MRILLLAAAVLAVATGSASGAARETMFADVSGDSGTAMDVTTVDVADNGDDIGFHVPFGGTLPTEADVLEILIDTDRNARTGDSRVGAEYMFFLQGGERASFGIVKFNGNSDEFTQVHFDDVEVRWDLGLEFDIAKADLGITSGFNFAVITGVGLPIRSPNTDRAPDTGSWRYDLTGIPPGIVFDSVVTTAAKKPRAGKAFQLQVAIRLVAGAESATRAPDALTCTASIGKTKLKTKVAAPSQRASTCTMTVPKKTKGKTLTVKLAARYGEQSKNATYTAKISA